MPIRIAIFDDNKNIRDSIALLLKTDKKFQVVGSFTNVFDCVDDVKTCKPDIILMDIEMPGMSGIQAVTLLKQQVPDVEILMQTVFEDDDRVFDSICAGASGYILKNQLNTKLISFVADLQHGGSPMSPSIARKVLIKMQKHANVVRPNIETPNDYQLSVREKEVLACIVNGLSHKMIADELNISYETVRSHVKKIYEKLHVASVTQAVFKAMKEKLV
jgi:DNA-binding NarL/FixJ family response regulator